MNSLASKIFGEDKEEMRTAILSLHLKRRIEETLIKCGMPVGLKGFQYIPEACAVLAEKPNIKITVMYEVVAKKFDTTASRVERSIRHAFSRTIKKGNHEMVQKYFGNENTNKNTLKLLLWNINREMEETADESTD